MTRVCPTSFFVSRESCIAGEGVSLNIHMFEMKEKALVGGPHSLALGGPHSLP